MIKVTNVCTKYENERGLFSFINQFLATCKFYKNKKDDFLFYYDLINKSSYLDCSIKETKNVWEYFFEVNKNEHFTKEIKVEWTDIGNYYGYKFDFNNKLEREEVSNIISENLILKPEILKNINQFIDDNFENKRVLGVHKRGTDIHMHHKIKSLEDYFKEIDLIIQDYDLIFLSTDEKKVVDLFKQKYSNVITHSYDSLSNSSNLPNFKEKTTNGYKIGFDALSDAYILSNCKFLIQTNSNLSNFALLANSNLKHKRII